MSLIQPVCHPHTCNLPSLSSYKYPYTVGHIQQKFHDVNRSFNGYYPEKKTDAVYVVLAKMVLEGQPFAYLNCVTMPN